MTGPLSLRLFFCLSLSFAVRNCHKAYAFYFCTNEISESNHGYISTTHRLAYTSGNGPSSATSSSVDSANKMSFIRNLQLNGRLLPTG